jgi:hypothetical protein
MQTVTCKCGRTSSNAPSKIKAPAIKGVLKHLQSCDPESNWDFVVNAKGQWQIGKAGA